MMIRRLKSICCLIFALCISLSSNVYAMNETEMATTVTYTEQDTGNRQENFYEISIPAEISLNEKCEIPLELTYMGLASWQSVTVYIDGDRSFPENDGYLHLYSPDSSDEKRVVVQRYDTATRTAEVISWKGLHEICCFNHENWYSPGIIVMLDALSEGPITPGTYYGTLYFTIELESN